MTGWQRFFLLIVCCIAVLVLWPQYNSEGLTFMGMVFILWTAVIMLFTVIVNMFAIYKLEFLHRLLSIALFLVIVASLLCYFPLTNNETPLSRMQNNVWPTLQDIRTGIKQITFNFDFVRRNVRRDSNYVNQKLDQGKKTTHNVGENIKKPKEILDIVVEPFKGEKDK